METVTFADQEAYSILGKAGYELSANEAGNFIIQLAAKIMAQRSLCKRGTV